MLIEFYGDITCPWSHLGWRRLLSALKMHGAGAALPLWRPFQLNPELPANGTPRNVYLLQKFASAKRVREALRAVDSTMKQDGLYVDLARITTMPNTALAHLLMLCAEPEHKTDILMELLFVAFFVHGQNVGALEVLEALGQRAGLSNAALDAFRQGSDAADAHLLPHRRTAQRLGIRAVPYSLFAGRYSLAGAHDSIAFSPLIDAALLTESSPEAAHSARGQGST